MRDLSILIPARNEEFLKQTVDDILKNKRGNTEIIVGLDGQWSEPGLPQHPDLKVLYVPKSIGQRAITNQLARLSNAKYVMKCDAHCSFDEGFDVKLMEDMQPHWTMVPKMYNLHAFDWVCEQGHRRYQGKSGVCTQCGQDTLKEIVWKAKPSPETTSMRFDKELRFQYWSGYKREQDGDLVPTMSLLGACWMLTRDKYWELEICDEGHGSWGQQGTEVACKTWLSGGELIVSKKTWFAHMFRTQGGDFGFPYPNPGIEKAREYSKDLWFNDKWERAKHPLSWLIDKFNPPDWDVSKGIIYYTDNQLNVKIAKMVQRRLLTTDIPITSVSLKPMPHFGDNVYLPLERGYLTMFIQILLALKRSTAEVVYFCEHDVMYHPSHFEFTPPKRDIFYYNTNVYKWDRDTGKAVRVDDCRQVSGICVYRETAIKHYEARLKKIEKMGFSLKMGFEPGTHNRPERVDDSRSETWESKYPNLDIRHDGNLTKTKWSPDDYRNQKYAKGWTETDKVKGWEDFKI